MLNTHYLWQKKRGGKGQKVQEEGEQGGEEGSDEIRSGWGMGRNKWQWHLLNPDHPLGLVYISGYMCQQYHRYRSKLTHQGAKGKGTDVPLSYGGLWKSKFPHGIQAYNVLLPLHCFMGSFGGLEHISVPHHAEAYRLHVILFLS